MSREKYNWLVNNIHDGIFKAVASKYLTGKLIDIGCGIKPYKNILHSYVSAHIGVDRVDTLHNKSNIDLFGTAYNISVDNSSFDSLICTAVLEHLEEPDLAIKEAYRVLKLGGYGIYSVPLFWHIHEEPRDFYRFTKYGLKYLFEKNYFEIVELIPWGGFCVIFGQELIYFLKDLGRKIKNPLFLALLPVLIDFIQRACYILYKYDVEEKYVNGYIIVVKK